MELDALRYYINHGSEFPGRTELQDKQAESIDCNSYRLVSAFAYLQVLKELITYRNLFFSYLVLR